MAQQPFPVPQGGPEDEVQTFSFGIGPDGNPWLGDQVPEGFPGNFRDGVPVEEMSVQKLREVIDKAGLDHSDCLEKADLRERAKQAIATGLLAEGLQVPPPAPSKSAPRSKLPAAFCRRAFAAPSSDGRSGPPPVAEPEEAPPSPEAPACGAYGPWPSPAPAAPVDVGGPAPKAKSVWDAARDGDLQARGCFFKQLLITRKL